MEKELSKILNSPLIADGTVKVGIDQQTIVTIALCIGILAVVIILLRVLIKKQA